MMRPFEDDDLILYLYGESPDATAIRTSAERDPALKTRLETLRELLDTVSNAQTAAPPADLEERLWQRLSPELEPRRWAWPARVARRHRPVLRRALALAAMLIVVVTAFTLGRLDRLGRRPATAASITLANDRILLDAVGQHLSRSQMLLREVSNAGLGADDAGALLADNRLYRQSAGHAGQAHLVAVLEALERVLVELANPPDGREEAHLEALRQRIDDQDLLFKLRVLGSRVHRSIHPRPTTDNAPAGARI